MLNFGSLLFELILDTEICWQYLNKNPQSSSEKSPLQLSLIMGLFLVFLSSILLASKYFIITLTLTYWSTRCLHNNLNTNNSHLSHVHLCVSA